MTAPDIITLDNLHEKIPLWSSTEKHHKYAIVDMGSNGIRFSITSLEPPTSRLLLPVYSTRAGISLFDALTPTQGGPVFPDLIIADVSSTIAHFQHLATLHGVTSSNVIIFATEAMRRAANASSMLAAIAKATDGLGVHILDPPVETLLGAVMGSRSGLVNVKGGALFLDLGGGSVQMTYLDTDIDGYEIKAALAGQSLPYGAAKLTRIMNEEAEGVKVQEVQALKVGIKDVYAKLCSNFSSLQAIKESYEKGTGDANVDLYMCGGGFRGYGSMLMHDDPISPYPISSINTYSVAGPRFRNVEKMKRLNRDYDGKIFGMSKRRRQQFPAIAAVVEAVAMAVPNIGKVTFCAGSNREGALMMKLPLDIRESNPLEVLADITSDEKPVFHAILQLVRSALPQGINFENMPTVLNDGLGFLFIREAWNRHGHDNDTNASFALHDAICRDSNAPGLTHSARAALGLTVAARWGGSLCPSDLQLRRGLEGILENSDTTAAFWSRYIGGVAAVITASFPIIPATVAELHNIRFKSHITREDGKKDKIVVSVEMAPDIAKNLDLYELGHKIEAAAKGDGDKKTPVKISTRVMTFS